MKLPDLSEQWRVAQMEQGRNPSKYTLLCELFVKQAVPLVPPETMAAILANVLRL